MRKVLKFVLILCVTMSALAGLLRPFSPCLEAVPWGLIAKIILVPLGILVTAVVGFFAYKIAKVRAEYRRASARRFARIAPLYEALEAARGINEEDVYSFAKEFATRWTTFNLLRERGLTDIFPREFYTIEHAAESKLAEWLENPNELASLPSEIDHVKQVEIETGGRKYFYQVFRFRVDETHWAASREWMLGFVGPYFEDSEPFDWPDATFSRLDSEKDVTPENEANWVHDEFVIRYLPE